MNPSGQTPNTGEDALSHGLASVEKPGEARTACDA